MWAKAPDDLTPRKRKLNTRRTDEDVAKMEDNCLFISARERINMDELKSVVYQRVKKEYMFRNTPITIFFIRLTKRGILINVPLCDWGSGTLLIFINMKDYRRLTEDEVLQLKSQSCLADDWGNVSVAEGLIVSTFTTPFFGRSETGCI